MNLYDILLVLSIILYGQSALQSNDVRAVDWHQRQWPLYIFPSFIPNDSCISWKPVHFVENGRPEGSNFQKMKSSSDYEFQKYIFLPPWRSRCVPFRGVLGSDNQNKVENLMELATRSACSTTLKGFILIKVKLFVVHRYFNLLDTLTFQWLKPQLNDN